MLVPETNDGKKSLRISISSDEPYLRYDWESGEEYYEVLGHDAGSVKDSRLRLGLPILFNHSRDQHIGRAKGYKNDGHKIDVGTLEDVLWSESAFAQEKKKDIENGSLVGTSVGYRIVDKGKHIGDKDGIPVYKFKWEPHEFSFCTIEADTNCGVGRDAENASTRQIVITPKEIACKTEEKPPIATQPPAPMPEPTTAPTVTIDPKSERNAAVAEFKARCQKIDSYVAGLKNPQWQKAAAEIATKHKSGDAIFEDFRAEALDAFEGVTRVTTEPTIGMGKRDLSGYSLVRAINCLAAKKPLDGLEKDASDAVAKLIGKDTSGFFIPQDVMQSRALTAGTFSAAGAMIESGAQGQSMIELYRNKMHVVALGARVLTGLQGNLAIPSQTGGATASWLSESGTITASDQSVGQVALTPHRLAAATAFTYQLLSQSSQDVESFVRNDLMAVLAIEKDRAALKGSGVSGEPLGIYLTANKSTSVTLAGANSMTYANAVQFEANVALNNADMGSLGYLVSVQTKANAKLIAEISSTNSNPVWKNDMVNGYPARATNQLTTLPSAIFGNWSDLIIGDWAGNEVIVDPYSLSLQGQVRIVMQQLSDVAIRHAKSFSISTT